MNGTRVLLRLALRRDRLRIAVWSSILGIFPTVTYVAFEHAYSERSRQALASSVSTSTGLWAVYGRPFDVTTSAGFTAWRVGSMLAVAVALVCTFTVVRHSRDEEETGRAEMLIAGSASRTSLLAAAALVAATGAAAVGVVTTICLSLAGAPFSGSVVFGASLIATGWVFTAIAAMICQMSTFARTANIVSSLTVAGAFATRAAGDGSAGLRRLTWASPLGWQQLSEPFASNRAATLAIPVVVGVLLAGCALALARRRDVGHGIVSLEPTRQVRRPVTSAWALAARVHRGAVSAWSLLAVTCGAVFGAITGAIVSILRADESSAEIIRRMGGTSSITFAYAGEILTVLALAAAGCGVQGILHERSEEMVGRLGWLVATDGRRRAWGTTHAATALCGSTIVMLVGAAGFAAAASQSTSTAPSLGVVLRGAAVRLPAVWLVVIAASVVVAAAPRLDGLAWAGLGACVVLAMFGESLQLPQWVLAISPFDHVPALTQAWPTWQATVAQLVLAVGGATASAAAFTRRDLLTG